MTNFELVKNMALIGEMTGPMTNFQTIKNMTVDEFAEWLDKNGNFDNSPWICWWDTHYCQKCEGIKVKYADYDKTCEASYCELNGNCRFFPNQPEQPDVKQIIKMWLEAQTEI